MTKPYLASGLRLGRRREPRVDSVIGRGFEKISSREILVSVEGERAGWSPIISRVSAEVGDGAEAFPARERRRSGRAAGRIIGRNAGRLPMPVLPSTPSRRTFCAPQERLEPKRQHRPYRDTNHDLPQSTPCQPHHRRSDVHRLGRRSTTTRANDRGPGARGDGRVRRHSLPRHSVRRTPRRLVTVEGAAACGEVGRCAKEHRVWSALHAGQHLWRYGIP